MLAMLTKYFFYNNLKANARVAKLADARDLKSRVSKETYRFNSGPGHQTIAPSTTIPRRNVMSPSLVMYLGKGTQHPRAGDFDCFEFCASGCSTICTRPVPDSSPSPQGRIALIPVISQKSTSAGYRSSP